jgi:competence protein ComFB
MRLQNYQEEYVLHVIGRVLENRNDLSLNETFVQDVAAYTLNRIPPKYVMSERGFTRMVSEHWLNGNNDEGLSNIVGLMLLINRAIEVVKKRRRQEEKGEFEKPGVKDLDEIEFWHNYPHVIGKVVDRDTHEPVTDASITLYINGKKSLPAEPGWSNPCHTTQATKGMYSFWPQPHRSERDEEKASVKIVILHPDYEEFSYEQSLSTLGGFSYHDYIMADDIINFGTAHLVKRNR